MIYIELVAGLMFLILFVILFLQWKNKRAVQGKLFTIMVEPNRVIIYRLLPIDKERVNFQVDKSKKEVYYIKPERTWTMLYPPNMPKLLQVSVQAAIYARNNPEPMDPFRPEFQALVTATVLRNMLDEKFTDRMLQNAERADRDDRQQTKPTLLYVLIGICAVISIVAVIMIMMQSKNIAALKTTIDTLTSALGIK